MRGRLTNENNQITNESKINEIDTKYQKYQQIFTEMHESKEQFVKTKETT